MGYGLQKIVNNKFFFYAIFFFLEENISAQEFLTYQYFKKNPEEVWDWHYEFKRMVRLSGPNICHFSVAEIQNFCEENDIECTLITQVFLYF